MQLARLYYRHERAPTPEGTRNSRAHALQPPAAFCWTKFGTEGGEDTNSILARKESERQANKGVFLWGIGNSIRPSLLALLDLSETPDVLFTPMRSRPAPHDVAPASLALWRSATGIDGTRYDLPAHSLVTSRTRHSRPGQRHYALVCQHDSALAEAESEMWIDHSQVRNLRSGTVVGSSQVTSVVSHLAQAPPGGPRYRVAFCATLVYPYLVVLGDPVSLPSSLRLSGVEDDEREKVLNKLHAIRATQDRTSLAFEKRGTTLEQTSTITPRRLIGQTRGEH